MRSDGIDDGSALGIGSAQERQQHTHPEVKPFKEEEPHVQGCDQNKPEYIEIHALLLPYSIAADSGSVSSSGSALAALAIRKISVPIKAA